MNVWIDKVAAMILLAVFVFSCAGHSGVSDEPVNELNLRVLDETYFDGGVVGKVLFNAIPSETGYAVEIAVKDAQNLKGLFFELDYNADLWHPVGCNSTGMLDLVGAPIDISYFGDPGTVSHGQVVQNYDQHEGFSGDGVLAWVEFAPGAAPVQRKTSTLGTPHGSNPIVFVDYYNKFLRVYHNIRGDYDQNGEVNLADIMPMSLFFGERSDGQDSGSIGSFTDGELMDSNFTNPKVYVDGNLDGEINLADLSTIAIQFGNSYSNIKICESEDYLGFYPFGGGMTNSAAVAITLSLPPVTGDNRTMRVYRDIELQQIDPLKHYWVHPGSGTEFGQASIVGMDLGSYPPQIDREFGLEYDTSSQILSFNPNLRGDYDLNGEVNMSDMGRVAVYFGNPGPFTLDKIEWNVDGNRDGAISLHDLSTIAGLLHRQGNISIYATTNPAEIPANQLAPEVIQRIKTLSILNMYDYDNNRETESLNDWSKGRNGVPLVDRPRIRAVINLDPGTYVWIRMYNAGGFEGPRSEVIQIP